MKKISILQRMSLGGLGGFVLALLLWMKAHNVLAGSEWSQGLQVTFVAFVTYTFLGVVIGALFAEPEGPNAHKLRRGVFISGLLAPSVLFTIISEPQFTGLGSDAPIEERDLPNFDFETPDIVNGDAQNLLEPREDGIELPNRLTPRILDFLVPTVHAQTVADQQAGTVGEPPVVTLKESDATLKLGEAILSSLGRPKTKSGYFYVIGASTNLKKIQFVQKKCTKALNAAIGKSAAYFVPTIIKASPKSTYYLSLGGEKSKAEVLKIGQTKKKLNIALKKESSSCAGYILRGEAVSTPTFYKKS